MKRKKRKGLPMGAAPNRLDDLFISEDEWRQELNIFEYQGGDTLHQALDKLHESVIDLGRTIVTEFGIARLVEGLAGVLDGVSNAINEFKRIGRKWIDG